MSVEKRISIGMSPIIKWAGGKEKELNIILNNLPESFVNYYEPFVGGGSVYTAMSANHYYINDKSDELISLYTCIASSEERFFLWVENIMAAIANMLSFVEQHRGLCELYEAFRDDKIIEAEIKEKLYSFLEQHKEAIESILPIDFKWRRKILLKELLSNLIRKFLRMKKIEKEKRIMPFDDIFDNIETAFMSSLYMYFRDLYNDKAIFIEDKMFETALFFYIRNYAYSGMFRYNSKGEFNVPYGGIGYNHKIMDKKISYYKSASLIEHFAKTTLSSLDFEEFLNIYQPQKNDFLFLDPPYDSTFSTYAQNEFTQEDQKRLANYLIHKCKANWMMIIKNTPFITSLYTNENLRIKVFDKKYLVSFMNRNDRNAEHLLIMNY